MKRMIALLLMMCTLTACASGAPEAAAPPETPPAETAPKEQAAAPESIEGTATFSQAAPEQLSYAVELETLADSAKAEDGTERETVKVNYGPVNGFSGIIEEVNNEKRS